MPFVSTVTDLNKQNNFRSETMPHVSPINYCSLSLELQGPKLFSEGILHHIAKRNVQ
jgi:hypothetical protein